MAKKKIDNLDNEKFNVIDVDFSNHVLNRTKFILEFLNGYENSEYLDDVMELLLDYAAKSSKTMVSSFEWLKNNYGIRYFSYKYKYYTQRKISKYLLDSASKNNKFAMAVGFQWASYSLGFSFEPFEMGRGNTLLCYKFKLQQSEGLEEYRKLCWNILEFLANRTEWKEVVLSFLDNYASNFYKKSNKDIVINEVKYIERLLSILKCNKISFLKVVKEILINSEKIGVIFDKKWEEIFNGEEWTLYQLLKNNYIYSNLDFENYKKVKEHKIIQYGKKLSSSDVQALVKNVNNILSEALIKKESSFINLGLTLIIQQFDEECLQEFLNAFIKFGNNISIQPDVVLNPLNQKSNPNTLLSTIKEATFPQKSEWLFSFFATLPESKVDLELLEELLDFLSNDSDKQATSLSSRSLRILDKFMELEPNIYPIATSLIYEKRNHSNSIVIIYFKLLFHEGFYSPKELLKFYNSNTDLLQDIYFYMLDQCELTDLNGIFLANFLSIDETWLSRYSKIFWENAKNINKYNISRTNALWKSNHFINYFDHILYNVPKDKSYRWRISPTFKGLLTNSNDDAIAKQHQQEWLTHIITENASNDWIYIIFDFVSELDDNTRIRAVQIFLENNISFETFNKLSLLPHSYFNFGSLIPEYQKQIDFLNKLNPFVTGMKFIEHRKKIKSKIEFFRKMIKEEEVTKIKDKFN